MTYGLWMNIHIKDETQFTAKEVSDFVMLEVGPDIGLFLMNSEQAMKLVSAASNACLTLKKKELINLLKENDSALD